MIPPVPPKNSVADRPAAGRPVRSYVLRGGRLTDGQRRALEDLWPRWGVADDEDVLNFAELFGNAAPVILEIGFGNGSATWRMAEAEPQHNFLGVEVHRPGVGRLLLQLAERGIGNVRVACTDAVELLRRRVPAASLAGVRIYFPDPWPKKRRIVQPAFVDLLAARMAPGAVLHLATDWAPYAEHMRDVMSGAAAFEPQFAGSGSGCRPDWRPETKYERRGERLGHSVYDLVYLHRPSPPSG